MGVTVLKTGNSVEGLQYVLSVTPSAGTAGVQQSNNVYKNVVITMSSQA